jgi:hypothetical protein
VTIEAELADGRVLEFPDGTDQAVIQATVKRVLGQSSAPTAGDRGQAALGGVNRGIAGIAGLPVDTAENLINLGIAGVGTAATALGRPDLAPDLIQGSVGGSRSIADAMQRAGVGTTNPRPDDAASRLLHTGGVIAGGSMVPGARPMPTAAAAAGGAIAGEVLGPEWTGVGAMAPAAAQQAAAAAKQAIASRTAPNVQTFKEAGTAPTVGQATESSFIRGLENLIAKFPGGVGVMRRFADKQQAELGAKARTGVSAEDAGRAIEQGIRGEGGFVQRFNQQQDVLYNKLDQYIPKDRMVDVGRTRTALADLNADIPGAPNVSKFFKNEKIQSIEGALRKDTSGVVAAEQSMPIGQLARLKTLPLNPADRKALFNAFDEGQLPYEAVKKLRTLVGREITDSTIASSVPKSKWKALYAALSDDMGTAAQQAGPKAEEAWKLANNYTRSGMQRIDSVLDRVIGNAKQPEDVFKAINPTDPDQANKLRAVMRSLTPAERQTVSEAIVNRLGRALPSKQNEVGEVFSSETFLTNWNKLSPGAKMQLFPNHSTRTQMDSIAKVSNVIREGSKTFANPSGTAGAVAPYGLGAMAFTGNIAAAGGMIATANIGGRMLTSPKVVEWLARAPNIRSENMAPHLARLGVIYNETKDDALKAELAKYMDSLQQ